MNQHNNIFSTWVLTELDKRGWNNKELANRAGIPASSLSMVLSETRPPGVKFCRKIAEAFGLPADDALRAAGIIPNKEPTSEEEDRLLYNFRFLDERRREEVIEITKVLRDLQEKGH